MSSKELRKKGSQTVAKLLFQIKTDDIHRIISYVHSRYWDCCSPSGSHPGKAAVNRPAKSCLKDGVTEASPNAQSGCQGGTSFSCLDYQPYVSKKDASLSYAFGARAEVNGESNFEVS